MDHDSTAQAAGAIPGEAAEPAPEELLAAAGRLADRINADHGRNGYKAVPSSGGTVTITHGAWIVVVDEKWDADFRIGNHRTGRSAGSTVP